MPLQAVSLFIAPELPPLPADPPVPPRPLAALAPLAPDPSEPGSRPPSRELPPADSPGCRSRLHVSSVNANANSRGRRIQPPCERRDMANHSAVPLVRAETS